MTPVRTSESDGTLFALFWRLLDVWMLVVADFHTSHPGSGNPSAGDKETRYSIFGPTQVFVVGVTTPS